MAPSAEASGTGNSAGANGQNQANGQVNGQTNGQAKASDFSYPPVIEPGTPYKVLPQYHSKPTKLRVACIGAGATGLCLAYKMEKDLVPDSWELTLFEKNPHFGGTWYENT